MFEKVQARVKQLLELSCGVAITTDLWSSMNADSYNAVTVHFFNEKTQQLDSKTLECSPFEMDHSAPELVKDIRKLLEQYAITDKVVTGLSDNASNIKAAFRQMNMDWMGCLAHVLNLIFEDAYKSNQEILTLGRKFMEIVTSVRVSSIFPSKHLFLQRHSVEF